MNVEEPPPDSEAPPRCGWTERSVQTQMERSGRSLKEDNRTQRVSERCNQNRAIIWLRTQILTWSNVIAIFGTLMNL